ncbi:MAG: RdgB/HAM1 family non-canonical purine NTP pyrophosphatase [Thermomicrobiales bacterium]|nr:RdgB/HAM1 family non-canonical purine NTP pyrophosphatase [Thermomicrobiales bacterium]
MTEPSTTVVLASSNKGKIRDLQALLDGVAIVVSGSELDIQMPEETGTTFLENALLKARAGHEQTGLTVLADDSGLEVDALNGEPGVYSARYAGEDASDEANNHKVLRAMESIPDNERGAHFRCAIAIVTADGEELTFEGSCDGTIGYESRGDYGFGYDPLFVLPDGRTMAEHDIAFKNEISHRGEAMRKAIPALREYLESKATRS